MVAQPQKEPQHKAPPAGQSAGPEPKSVEYPMPSLVHADRVIDELYGDHPEQRIPWSKIEAAEAKASVAPDVITYFRRIERKDYTKQELIDALNQIVRERHRVPEVGLFGVGEAAREAKTEAENP